MQDIKGTCRQSSDQSDEPSRCMGRVAVRRFDLQTEELDFKVILDSNFVRGPLLILCLHHRLSS